MDEAERHVLVAPHPLADVLVQDAIERADQVPRAGCGVHAHQRLQGALDHQHDQAGGQAVTRHVADPDPGPPGDGDDVVVIATDDLGRRHARRDLEPLDVDLARQQRALDVARYLVLMASVRALRRDQVSGSQLQFPPPGAFGIPVPEH
jgi:hypothetical protein